MLENSCNLTKNGDKDPFLKFAKSHFHAEIFSSYRDKCAVSSGH